MAYFIFIKKNKKQQLILEEHCFDEVLNNIYDSLAICFYNQQTHEHFKFSFIAYKRHFSTDVAYSLQKDVLNAIYKVEKSNDDMGTKYAYK